VQFRIGAVLQPSNTPSFRVTGFEDEDENEAPHEKPWAILLCHFVATAVSLSTRAVSTFAKPTARQD
jgi:hypothetical protein